METSQKEETRPEIIEKPRPGAVAGRSEMALKYEDLVVLNEAEYRLLIIKTSKVTTVTTSTTINGVGVALGQEIFN